MPASLDHIHPGTPMGANLMADGATFRVWAPHARSVHVIGDFNDRQRNDSQPADARRPGPLARISSPACATASATCSMSLAKAARARSAIPTPASYRRLSRATASSAEPISPGTRADTSRRSFMTFVIYQLHVGTFFTPNLPRKAGTFLDVARKIPHLADLGVTAIQLMPIQEFQTQFSLGYNGTDYFSPEMDFAVEDADLAALCRGGERAARRQGPAALYRSRICAAR